MKPFDKFMYVIVYHFFKVLSLFVFHVTYDVRFKNTKNVPRKGGILCMANHSSFWDPPLVGCGTWKRPFKFMARDSLFRFPIWGKMIFWMGAFPVKRGTVDRNAWSTLIDNVNNGDAVVFFPEGTRTVDGELQKGKPGTGMLVYQAKATVIPVYIHGAYDVWPKGRKLPKLFKRIYVYYGKALTFEEFYDQEPNKEIYIKITEKIMSAIAELKEEHLKSIEAKKK